MVLNSSKLSLNSKASLLILSEVYKEIDHHIQINFKPQNLLEYCIPTEYLSIFKRQDSNYSEAKNNCPVIPWRDL